MIKILSCIALIGVFYLSGCVHKHTHKPKSFWQKAASLVRSPDSAAEELQSSGAFEFDRFIGKRIFLKNSGASVIGDLYFAKTKYPTPLVIFSHGNKSFKEAHRVQAERFASWGFNVINLQFPNRKKWVKNGKLLSEVVHLLTEKSRWLGQRFDKRRVFVVGHSFGGSSATLAASQQSKITGLILLDPAVVHSLVLKEMTKVKVPVFLLGADRRRYKAKRRDHFFKNLGGQFLELSVAGSTHNDAQYPSMTQIFALGFDPAVSGVYQERFLTLGLIAAFDLTMNKQMTFARTVYEDMSRVKKVVKNLKWRNSSRTKNIIY